MTTQTYPTLERTVKIKTLDNQIYEFQVSPDIPIGEFKKKIQQRTQVPVDRQRLVYMGKVLVDDSLLSNHVKDDGQTVHLIARAQAAPPQPEPQQQQAQPQQQPQQPPNPFAALGGFNPLSFLGNLGNGGNMVIRTVNSNGDIGQSVGNILNSVLGLQPAQPVQQPRSPSVPQTQPQGMPYSAQQRPQVSSHTHAQPHTHHHPHTHAHPHQPISLPFNILYNLGIQIGQLMGPEAMFPGPPLPQYTNRNGAQVLGSYLSSWHFQMMRLLPFVYRLGELLQREQLLTDPIQREQVSLMSHRISAILESVASATTSVTAHYRNLRLGAAPGEFRIASDPIAEQQPQAQNVFAAQSSPLGVQHITIQTVVSDPNLISQIGQSLSSPVQQPQAAQSPPNPTQPTIPTHQPQQQARTSQPNPNPAAMLNNLLSGFGLGPQPQPTQSGQQPQMPDLSSLLSSFGGIFGAPPAQPQAQPAPSSPAQPTQATRATQPTTQPTVQTQSPAAPSAPSQPEPASILSNPLISSMMSSGMFSSIGATTFREMLKDQNASQQEQQQSIYSLIVGDFTGTDLIQAFTTKNFSFLDAKKPLIQKGVQQALARYGNSRHSLFDKIVTDALEVWCGPELEALVMEGFNARSVASEILHKHLQTLFTLTLSEESGTDRYSEGVVRVTRKMVGELFYELSEGVEAGFPEVLRCVRTSLLRILDPYVMGMGGILFGFIQSNLVTMYQEHRADVEREKHITADDQKKEQQLLKDIEQQAKKHQYSVLETLKKPKSPHFE